MSQPQPNIVQLAKQGNPKAIAALINRQLQAKGITVKVSIQDGYLQIILEALEIPNQKTLVAFIHKGIMSLESTAIKTVTISGKCINKDLPSWIQEIEINLEYDEAKKNQLFSNCSSYQTNKKHDYAAIIDSVKVESTSDLNIVQKDNKENNYQQEPHKNIPKKLTLPILIISIFAINFFLIVMYSKNNPDDGAIVDLDGTVKSNKLLSVGMKQYIDEYSPNKNNVEEGILKLTDLAKNYKTSFFTNTSECGNSSYWQTNNEVNKNKEIQAQVNWELGLVKKQEEQDFLGETDIDDVSLFQQFIRSASKRIITEKECGSIENSKFPLQPINYPNNKYTYIIKANQEIEIGYIVYRQLRIYSTEYINQIGMSIIYQVAFEAYMKNQIQNMTSQKKDINYYLKNGYQICQKLRDIMETSQSGVKLSVKDATKTMIEDKENKIFIGINANSVNDEQEVITFTVVQLCPQLMK